MTLPARLRYDFLERLSETGNVCAVCRSMGLARTTAYEWRSDPDFADRWDEALDVRRESIRQELVEKGMILTGRVVEDVVRDPETGDPLLDDDFEPVTVRSLVGYDPRIFVKMLDRLLDAPVQRIDQRTAVAGRVDHVHDGQPDVELVYIDSDGQVLGSAGSADDDAEPVEAAPGDGSGAGEVTDADFEELD